MLVTPQAEPGENSSMLSIQHVHMFVNVKVFLFLLFEQQKKKNCFNVMMMSMIIFCLQQIMCQLSYILLMQSCFSGIAL